MLKITRSFRTPSQEAVIFEGKLMGPWVVEAREQLAQSTIDPNLVLLDLAQLTYADQAGVELLNEMLRSGARIAACSTFITELLELETMR